MHLDDVIEEIRAMGDEPVVQSRDQGTSARQVLLQTVEDILTVVKEKPVKEVGWKVHFYLHINSLTSDIGIHEMWAVC